MDPSRARLTEQRRTQPRTPNRRQTDPGRAESITGWWSRPPPDATRFEKARFSEASPRRAQAIDSINLITEREPPEAANRSKLDHRNGRDGERSPNTRGALEHGWTRVERASPSSGARNRERRNRRQTDPGRAESITGWWSRPPPDATRFEKARFSGGSPRRAQAIDSINLITEREPPEAANRSKLDHRNGRDGERSPNTRGALEHGWTRVERASPSSGARNRERRTAAKPIREERNRSQDGGRDRRLTRRVLKKRASREGRRDERKRSIRST